MLKVTYDTEVDAKYVSVKDGKIKETKIINDWLFFDCDDKGDVIGIEILDASKNHVTVSAFDGDLVNVNFVENASGGASYNKDFGEQKGKYLRSNKAAVLA